jgi:DNA (cytosine-5)-methyltransferase 1
MFKFVDLFAGIGGMRIAFQRAGGTCVFTSEWDRFSQITYEVNHGDRPAGDITKINEADIPTHDVLVAGFPCQPFSIAGVTKKNSLGREHGFRDETQGTLFFDIARILDARRPKAFLLENVKNLKSHNKGKTFRVITDTLTTDLGYNIFPMIIDAQHYVPQHRERIFIVGLRADLYPDLTFKFRRPPQGEARIASILQQEVDPRYTLSDHLWGYLQNYKAKHQSQGNGFGFGLIDPQIDTVTRTLSARYHKDGSEILIKQPGKNPRRLTPRECARLMGYDDSFEIPVSDTQAYRQFGNSVAVPVVTDVAMEIAHVLADSTNSPAATWEGQGDRSVQVMLPVISILPDTLLNAS